MFVIALMISNLGKPLKSKNKKKNGLRKVRGCFKEMNKIVGRKVFP
jgi:hypothetical protein